MRKRFLVALLLASSPTTTALGAAWQGQGANAIASEAMQMLRSGPFGRGIGPGEPLEVVSSVPPTFPQELIADGGSVAVVGVSASATTIVLSFKPEKPFERYKYLWTLEAKGWTNTSPMSVGFAMGSGSRPTLMCRAQDFANVTTRRLVSGELLLRVSIGKDPTRSCAPTGMRSFSDVPIPELELPPGARSTSGGGSGGIDDTEGRSRIDTSLDVQALMDHFGQQMKSSGWKLEGTPSGDAVMAVTRWTALTKAGDPVTAIILMTRLSESSVDGLLRVIRNKPVARLP